MWFMLNKDESIKHYLQKNLKKDHINRLFFTLRLWQFLCFLLLWCHLSVKPCLRHSLFPNPSHSQYMPPGWSVILSDLYLYTILNCLLKVKYFFTNTAIHHMIIFWLSIMALEMFNMFSLILWFLLLAYCRWCTYLDRWRKAPGRDNSWQPWRCPGTHLSSKTLWTLNHTGTSGYTWVSREVRSVPSDTGSVTQLSIIPVRQLYAGDYTGQISTAWHKVSR